MNYQSRTLLAMEDLYGPHIVNRLLEQSLDEGFGQWVAKKAAPLAIAGMAAFGGMGSAHAQDTAQAPKVQQTAQQTPLHKAMNTYHNGAHAQTVSDNIARSNRYLPQGTEQHTSTHQRHMQKSNPATASRSHWTPDDHAAMQRAHQQMQHHVAGAQNVKERGQRTAQAGEQLHRAFNSINSEAGRIAARTAR